MGRAPFNSFLPRHFLIGLQCWREKKTRVERPH